MGQGVERAVGDVAVALEVDVAQLRAGRRDRAHAGVGHSAAPADVERGQRLAPRREVAQSRIPHGATQPEGERAEAGVRGGDGADARIGDERASAHVQARQRRRATLRHRPRRHFSAALQRERTQTRAARRHGRHARVRDAAAPGDVEALEKAAVLREHEQRVVRDVAPPEAQCRELAAAGAKPAHAVVCHVAAPEHIERAQARRGAGQEGERVVAYIVALRERERGERGLQPRRRMHVRVGDGRALQLQAVHTWESARNLREHVLDRRHAERERRDADALYTRRERAVPLGAHERRRQQVVQRQEGREMRGSVRIEQPQIGLLRRVEALVALHRLLLID
mmetsp:Transcript_3781/g.9816  ORF Transcript_3781/g.9816 Transcript_3781/m.9816 type:complete len:340 (+) Transcript_3781:806-1825(+)